MAKMEADYNLETSGERFQILCLYLAKVVKNLLWFALLPNIHLILFKIYLKIVLKLQPEEKRETTIGFHVRLNQRILDLTDSSSYLDVCIDFLEYKEWCSARKRRTWSEINFKANNIIMNGGKMELGATKLSQNHVLIILSWMLLKEKRYIFSLWVLFCFVVKIMLFILWQNVPSQLY